MTTTEPRLDTADLSERVKGMYQEVAQHLPARPAERGGVERIARIFPDIHLSEGIDWKGAVRWQVEIE